MAARARPSSFRRLASVSAANTFLRSCRIWGSDGGFSTLATPEQLCARGDTRRRRNDRARSPTARRLGQRIAVGTIVEVALGRAECRAFDTGELQIRLKTMHGRVRIMDRFGQLIIQQRLALGVAEPAFLAVVARNERHIR